ncbi:hypothetical protein DFQ28_003483 [Apophysomyces sp. BC1034]|nr:hypothetical protein DFQ30_003344 [Apophysomyces sp. BC1015]KAG0176344.1 hypothetical protein DFQ29_006269 [Apophysomyces sp. BC1021]KAG0189401.1 hypothetical protein DFQ28_003483 [Apophysomyces sp. BC1034]
MAPYTVEVRWDSRRFHIEFNQDEFQNATVGDLKRKCQLVTDIDPLHMKLLAYGAIMKNDGASLGVYGVRPGSIVRLMGSPKGHQTHGEKAVLSSLEGIHNKLSKELVPDINDYEHKVKSYLSDPNRDTKHHRKLADYGVYLGEQLMKILFELDGIMCADFDKARQERKLAVNMAQSLLDRVDQIKGLLL